MAEGSNFVSELLKNKIQEEVKGLPGGYKQLAEQIAAAAEEVRGRRSSIDRRKLSRIAEGERVTLTLDELDVLDLYFRRFGKGLADVLASPGWLDQLVESRREICFLLGARPGERENAISRWDVRSLAELLQSIFRQHRAAAIPISIEDVLLCDVKTMRRRASTDELDKPHWLKILDAKQDGPSVVCIGSPRSCHATECMLAKMVGIEPFRSSPPLPTPFPVRYVYPSTTQRRLSSSFAVDGAAVSHDATAGITYGLQWTDRAEEIHWVNRKSSLSWRTYGIVAAQRQPRGQLWLCVSGLTAPGTLAAARKLAVISSHIPLPDDDRPSPVMWAVIQAEVERTHHKEWENGNDPRHLAGQALLKGPFLWPLSS